MSLLNITEEADNCNPIEGLEHKRGEDADEEVSFGLPNLTPTRDKLGSDDPMGLHSFSGRETMAGEVVSLNSDAAPTNMTGVDTGSLHEQYEQNKAIAESINARCKGVQGAERKRSCLV